MIKIKNNLFIKLYILIIVFALLTSCAEDSSDSDSGNTETEGPKNISISINSGDASTDSLDVILTLAAQDSSEVVAYYVSESETTPASSSTEWVAVTSSTVYSDDVSFDLSGQTGTKTVYAWYKDGIGNVSNSCSDSIEFPLGIEIDPISGNTSEEGGTATFSMNLKTKPDGDVVIDIISLDTSEGDVSPDSVNFDDTNWENKQSITVTGAGDTEGDGDQNYEIQISIDVGSTTDSTGYSVLEPDELTVVNTAETVSPSNASIIINSQDATTDSLFVTLFLDASDNSGVTGYFVSDSSSDPSADSVGWVDVTSDIAFSGSPTFIISDTTGDKTVFVWFRDAEGNISDETSDTIELPFITSKIPDTGQTYSHTGVTGEDSEYSINLPAFTDFGNGSVLDNNTFLTWQKEDDDTTRNYADALTYCNELSLAGKNDWRVPNPKELHSIVNYQNATQHIDSFVFPNTKAFVYRTSTAGWCVQFLNGYDSPSCPNATNYYVRCVRGLNESDIWSPDFLDNGDGTIYHQSTGLTWQAQDDDNLETWTVALGYCDGLSLGGYNDWRLPNIKELRSIHDSSFGDPAIDQTYFPGIGAAYWSSTVDVSQPTTVSFRVYTTTGQVDSTNQGSNAYARCVRGGN